MEWQPIETAPKDGTPVLACTRLYVEHGFLPVSVRWRTFHPNAKGNETWRDANGHQMRGLTHWMPLPEPPK